MEARRGTWYAVTAYVLWGLSPIYWNLLPDIGATTLILSRIVWSVPILIAVLAFTGKLSSFAASYRSWRPRLITAAAAGFLFINWALFVWSVANDHIVDASLGYFINPLVSVGLGVVILGERLRKVQWIAIGIAAAGVAIMTIAVGALPWISLTLAFSFGTYGLLKKQPETPPPVVSLLGETSLIAVPALIYAVLFNDPTGPTFGTSTAVSIFLVGAGVVTVVPLLLFGGAAKRIPLSMVGLLQYITPSIQLFLGVVVYGETLSSEELIGFIAVWTALALYSADSFRAKQPRVKPIPLD
ncbi:MAG: EamA family transporter RarD [Actinomycetia bacterium]|nr:EamA family transporter RarD [Actinomycetes bacterium]